MPTDRTTGIHALTEGQRHAYIADVVVTLVMLAVFAGVVLAAQAAIHRGEQPPTCECR